YNGYKVYGADGGQLVPEHANKLIEYVHRIQTLGEVNKLNKEEAEAKGLLQWLDLKFDHKYITAVTSTSLQQSTTQANGQLPFKIIYTPLHGTGNKPVREALNKIGFEQVIVVPEQE